MSGSNTVSVLLNTTAPGATTPSFATQQTFATGSDPSSVTVADVNGDGKPDLIVDGYHRQHGVGAAQHHQPRAPPRPSFATQQTFATGIGPDSVTAADINGDGKPDLIVATSQQHGVGAAQHHRPRRRHAQLRHPADLCHRPAAGLR